MLYLITTPRKAFEWIISKQGIAKEKDYKFNAKRGNCKKVTTVRFLLKLINLIFFLLTYT